MSLKDFIYRRAPLPRASPNFTHKDSTMQRPSVCLSIEIQFNISLTEEIKFSKNCGSVKMHF